MAINVCSSKIIYAHDLHAPCTNRLTIEDVEVIISDNLG